MHRLNYPEFVESRAALASEARRIRRIIHHQIYARELAQVILGAKFVAEISSLLEGKAAVFGFQRMVVARQSELDDDRCAGASRRAPHGWKLDYEIMGAEYDDDPYVLRICCASGSLPGACLDGAERVARIVGPAVEECLLKSQAEAPAVAPAKSYASQSINDSLGSRVPVGAV